MCVCSSSRLVFAGILGSSVSSKGDGVDDRRQKPSSRNETSPQTKTVSPKVLTSSAGPKTLNKPQTVASTAAVGHREA